MFIYQNTIFGYSVFNGCGLTTSDNIFVIHKNVRDTLDVLSAASIFVDFIFSSVTRTYGISLCPMRLSGEINGNRKKEQHQSFDLTPLRSYILSFRFRNFLTGKIFFGVTTKKLKRCLYNKTKKLHDKKDFNIMRLLY